ncbi:response regulator [Desulfonema ishimotonii]|uniref:Response regulator n=1 Tax=Desulfonema ishimotonii TaxID=45657 RepID=A0A401FSW7_9BACT|nr:response regulator [Desulfonema ishimotonii]GBC60046.1 response regulator [Desulfonema ishimotonii]
MSDNICILVVDDFSTMRRIIKKILKGFDLTNVLEAENGSRAWEILNEQNVDLVICDWNMPEMTGMELLEKVRTHDNLSELPFIMVTAEGKGKTIVEPGKENLTNYIAKPFKPQDMEEKLKLMLHI